MKIHIKSLREGAYDSRLILPVVVPSAYQAPLASAALSSVDQPPQRFVPSPASELHPRAVAVAGGLVGVLRVGLRGAQTLADATVYIHKYREIDKLVQIDVWPSKCLPARP